MNKSFFLNYDLVRLTACVLVVLHHIYGSVNEHYPILYSITSTCVPLFILLSGSLLLNKKYSLLVFYKKRILKILLPAFFWVTFYSLFRLATDYFNSGNLEYLLILKNSIGMGGWPYYHLWYLYLIFLLYIISPFLQKIHFLFGKKYILITQIILCTLFQFLALKLENSWLQNLTYYCLGGIVSRVMLSVDTSFQKIMYFIIIIITLLSFLFEIEEVAVLALSVLIFISILILPAIKWMPYSVLLSLTFGVYLIHPLLIKIVSYLPKIGLIFDSNFLKFLIVFISSTIIAYLFKKNDILKRLI